MLKSEKHGPSSKVMNTRLGKDSSTVRTRHWQRSSGGKVVCNVCPRTCELQEGQRGLCFVRACEDEEVVLTSYGRSSGFCVDPIEKKPLNHFLPGTPALSFGTGGSQPRSPCAPVRQA